jgi:hypothetical protein
MSTKRIKYPISLIPSIRNNTLGKSIYNIKNSNNFIKEKKQVNQKERLKTLFKNLKLNYNIKNVKSEGLPGLSVKIFKKFFLSSKWPYLTTQRYDFIKESYYGGSIFHLKTKGKRLFYYDINSLYPYSLINKFPIRKPRVKKFPKLNESFGFIKAVISAPNFMQYDFLPRKGKLNALIDKRVWIGTYFSEELKFAESIGYSITPVEGLIYNSKENILADFILYLYGLKVNHPITTKILLNSFYGKLSSRNSNTLKFSYKPTVLASIDQAPLTEKKLASIIIASTTTSYARIFMFKKMNLRSNPSYYSDTDSIVTQHKIEKDKKHQRKIGLFKNTIHTKKENKSFLNSMLLKKPRTYSYSTLKKTTILRGVNYVSKKVLKPNNFHYSIVINGILINSIYIVELI